MQQQKSQRPDKVGDAYALPRPQMDRSRLAAALEIIGSVSDCSLPLHQVQIVLFVGEHGSSGVTYAAIEERLGLSNAAVSRSINSLSTHARHRRTEPMGLVRIFIDPEEGRRYRVALTKKGEALMRALDQL